MKVILASGLAFLASLDLARADHPKQTFRAGAAAVDVSPTRFPVKVNGGFLEAKGEKVLDPLYARALVLDDGSTRLAIVVVDSCMMPRDLLDHAKRLAREATGIPSDHILISATHTHTAPASMGALGCAADAVYADSLPARIAGSIVKAAADLRPAKLGWGSVDDAEDTHSRRWIRRADKPVIDPFGRPSARAQMHPGYQNPDTIGPAGPVDPELSVLAVKTLDDAPVALLANYSMHYFGAGPVSADYFGRFARTIGGLIGAKEGKPFIGMMSQGTSGDQHWMDYDAPQKNISMNEYADRVAGKAAAAFSKIVFHDHVPLAMVETTLRLERRTPDEARLAWARAIVGAMGNRAPKTLPEVYAKEAIYLHDDPVRELKLQAIRIGDLGITAIPDEVYALSGLKIKARSPLRSTFTIELANGSEGYIPPPEQHALGGYTTWPARTAALEEQAEPKIVEAVVGLLEKATGKPSRTVEPVKTPYAEAVLKSRPWAYWRMEEMDGSRLVDASGQRRSARLLDGYARYLDGPASPGSSPGRPMNHAVQLVGGAITAEVSPSTESSTVVLAFWDGLPTKNRPARILLDRGDPKEIVMIDGGRLLVGNGSQSSNLAGRTTLDAKRWYLLVVVRTGGGIEVYLDGKREISGKLPGPPLQGKSIRIGGDPGSSASFEGKVDEVAVFDRALSAEEVAGLQTAFRK